MTLVAPSRAATDIAFCQFCGFTGAPKAADCLAAAAAGFIRFVSPPWIPPERILSQWRIRHDQHCNSTTDLGKSTYGHPAQAARLAVAWVRFGGCHDAL